MKLGRPPKKTMTLAEAASGNIVEDSEIDAEEREREIEERRRARAEELSSLDGLEDGDFFKAVEELEQAEGVNFVVIRVKPAHKRGYVGTIPAADMSLESLKQKFGPGTYRCRAQGPKGFVAGGGTATVADFVEDKSAVQQMAGKSMLHEFLEIQEISEERRNARMLQYAQILAPVVAGFFANRGQTDVAALVTALKPAPAPSLSEFATTLASLKSLGAEKSSDLDVFMKALEFSKDLNRGDRETGWMDIVKEIAAPLIGKVGGGAIGPAFPLPPRSLPPAVNEPSVYTDQAQPAQGQNVNAIQWMQFFRTSLDQLIHQAARNRDPGLYAEVLVDNLPEESNKQKLLQFLGREDWWTAMSKFHGGVLPYQGWFTQLREQVILILTEKEESGQPEGEANGT